MYPPPVPELAEHSTSIQEHCEQPLPRLDVVRRVISAVARQYGLDPEDERELLSDTLLKLVSDDCAVMRAFRGDGGLNAYLRVVAQRILLDRRIKAWGKWRPTRRAKNLGSAAVHLERLLVRDRLPPREALRMLVEHPRFSVESGEARTLYAALDVRLRPIEVELEASCQPRERREVGDDPCELSDLGSLARRVSDALRLAIARLAPEDRQLLRLRFRQGSSVAEMSRGLSTDQKALYRRFDRVFKELRTTLEAMGVAIDDVRMVVGHVMFQVRTAIPEEPAAVVCLERDARSGPRDSSTAVEL